MDLIVFLRKHIGISCLCFTFLFIHSISAQENGLKLTLEECIERAKLNSRAIDMAEFDVQGTIAEKNLMRSAFLPQIDLEGVINNCNRTLADDLTQFQDFKSTKAAGIKAMVGLWDFGSTWKRFKASKLRISAAEEEKERVCLEIEEQVHIVYLKVLETSKMVHVLDGAIATLRNQLSQSNQRLEEGLLKTTDVLAIEVQVIEREKALLQLKNALVSQTMLLNKLIGVPLCTEVCLSDLVEESACVDYDDALCYAMKCRPELLAFERELCALYCERKAIELSSAPKIYAFANSNFSAEEGSLSAGIGLNMPLYRGGRRSACLHKIDSEIGKLQLIIEEANESLLLELKSLFFEFSEIDSSLRLSEKAIALAEQQFIDANDLLLQGLFPIQDYLIAQDQFNSAKMSYLSNFYRLHQAYARLKTTTGGYPNNY